jgi:polysaccharide biosynthesis/export protein
MMMNLRAPFVVLCRRIRHMSSLCVLIITCVIITCVLAICAQAAVAQNQSASAARPQVTGNSSPKDERYRIGPGDVIDVTVFGKPQFSRQGVKVDTRGMIRMPLVKQEIMAACHTEDELASDITEHLKEYIREPEVIVQIKEYLAEPVAVIGAVRSPSRFQLQRRATLLEMLTLVNGPAENAGRTIQVVHQGSPVNCPSDAPTESMSDQVDYYKLSETMRGDANANPYVRAGDVVSIAKADEIYVVGNVVRPASIALNESITVTRAIAMAGGTLPDTKRSEIRIVRQAPGSTQKQELVVNLDSINRHQSEDVIMMPNDIIEVPTSAGKRFLRSLLGAVVPSVAQLPVRVVP